MKSKWRLVLVFFLMLVVTACNQTNTSSSNSVSYPSMSGSSTSSTQGGQTIQDWEQEDKDLMIEIVSEVIPVAPLTSNYLCISDEDEYGPYLYIYDEQSPDISEEYSDILIANGYLYDSFSEGYYFYYKEVSEESLLILQFGYYPGDSDYPASMDLFAWLEGNTSSLETITSWDQELLDMMQEVLSTPLPVASLTKQYDYMNYVDDVGDNIVYIYDLYVDDISNEYAKTLEENGYILEEEGTEDEPYFLYSILIADAQIYVQIDYFYGFEIFAWKNQNLITSLTQWPTQEIENVLQGLNLTIPAYLDASSYRFELYDATAYSMMISVCEVQSEALTIYNQILTTAEWTIIEEKETGNVALDPSQQYILEYWYDQDNQMLCIYFDTYGSVPVLSWPAQQLVQFLKLQDVVVPAFSSTSYLIENQIQSFVIYASASSIDSEDIYLQTLKDQLWVVDSSQYETLGHIAIDSTNQVQLTFYYSNSYLIITVERIIEVKETLRLLPTDFSSQSYAANEGEVTIQEIRFTCHNVMNQQGKIQIKKSNNDEDSYFYNNDALNLVSLQLENLFGSPTIYGCYSAGDYTNGVAIEADENGVYSLYSFNYFCIVSGTGVTTMSELIIELA